MATQQKQVRIRKAALKAAGATYADLARLAGVSWTMAWMWMNGQRTSARLEAVYHKLTGNVAASKATAAA